MSRGLFDRPKKSDKDLIDKVKSAKPKKTKVNNIPSKIQDIVTTANSKLSKYKDKYLVIQDKDELHNYISNANESTLCAIDTETTGLNPMDLDLVGVCLYTPNEKAAYVPVGHKSYITGQKINSQLSIEEIKSELERFTGNWIMHNAKFDIRVLRHTMDLYLSCYWDTSIAAQCIDENESHKLKDLHLKYCDSLDKESLTFSTLFKGVTFDLVPIATAYLYAAGDAIKTFELYEYQKALLEKDDMAGPYNVFMNIEMPIVEVCADMEDYGVCLDLEISKQLQDKYHKIRDEQEIRLNNILKRYDDRVEQYKIVNPKHKLDNPINVASPTQLAILFYDILNLESPIKKSPRGTGEEILKHFAQNDIEKDLCNAILDIRGTDKLLSTYIDKMPEIVQSDGRIHCRYNQAGTKTGRFSSSDPNMQNIPSHNKEIRTMFKAQDGFVLVGSDYSQQEPMVTSYLSQDQKMMQSFIDGKDIYSTIASLAFHKTYQECLEFKTDENGEYILDSMGERIKNNEGAERRFNAKGIVLGILYGRQIPSIAETLGVSNKEAQNIYDTVLRAFPQLADFIEESQTMAKEKGYVTTAWGRRRHLPDMQLEEYSFSLKNNSYIGFDPLSFDSSISNLIPINIKNDYIDKLNKAFGWANKNQIIQDAKSKGISIIDNQSRIAQAERQCVNSRVQGSSADMIKIAMVKINNDEEMKKLGAHLIIQVHDEVIVECPKENADKVADRLSFLMCHAPAGVIDLPLKCDCDQMKNWYLKEE